MHCDSLMGQTKEIMKVVAYDPHRFLRAIERCKDDKHNEWLKRAPSGEAGRCRYIAEQARSALSFNQLNEEDSLFVSLIEDAIKNIEESPKEKYGFFLSVQEQISHHKNALGSVHSFVSIG